MDIDHVDFNQEPFDCAVLLSNGHFPPDWEATLLFPEMLIPVGVLNLLTDQPWNIQRLATTELLHPTPDRRDWRRWLDAVFISSELGAEKPSPEIFAKAAETLGAAPHELLHVGDSLEHDIAGALAAGWHAAWLDYGKPVELDPRALRLKSLAELPGLLSD